MKPPDLSALLPSQARKVLTQYLLERLEQSELDGRGNPRFARIDARLELDDDAHYARSIIEGCFQEAFAEYERRHPLRWVSDDETSLSVFRLKPVRD